MQQQCCDGGYMSNIYKGIFKKSEEQKRKEEAQRYFDAIWAESMKEHERVRKKIEEAEKRMNRFRGKDI